MKYFLLILFALVSSCATAPQNEIKGGIDRNAIDEAIKAKRTEFVYCYEREVNAGHADLDGKLNIAFVIGADGKASQITILNSTLNNTPIENCVRSTISRISFPKPTGGISVHIKYPFNFSKPKK